MIGRPVKGHAEIRAFGNVMHYYVRLANVTNNIILKAKLDLTHRLANIVHGKLCNNSIDCLHDYYIINNIFK